MTSAESPRITYERDGTALGCWRNVLIPVFLESPKEAMLQRATQDIRALSLGGKRKVFWCAFFRATGTMPDAKGVDVIRTAFMALLRETSAHMQASANVIDGGGFVGAALRAAGSGLITVSRMPYPIKIFSAVNEATGYLAKQGAEGSGLERAVGDVVALAEMRQEERKQGRGI